MSCAVVLACVQGQWQVVFSKTSRLTQSRPSEAFEKFYETRIDSHDTCEWPTDLSKVAVHCSIPSLPRISVRQMLLKVAERQPGPFRLQLRLLGHLPQDLQQWCKMRPQEGGGKPVWEWAAHLWLEDATGQYSQPQSHEPCTYARMAALIAVARQQRHSALVPLMDCCGSMAFERTWATSIVSLQGPWPSISL